MHVVEAATIMANTPPVGRGDSSKCLPGWIETFCDAFERGSGYAMNHSAVGAMTHTLISSRVRTDRLVAERDAAVNSLRQLLATVRRITNILPYTDGGKCFYEKLDELGGYAGFEHADALKAIREARNVAEEALRLMEEAG